MAAVLEEYFAGKISSQSVVLWLSSNKCVFETENEVFRDHSLRADFLPFFINYLREQTSHLICHGASSAASPVKTPASAQKFWRLSQQHQNPAEGPQRQECSGRDTQRRLNRTQLFSPSPLRSEASEGTLTQKPLCSEEESPLRIATEEHSWHQGGHFYLKTPLDECKGRTKKSSSSFHKKEEHATLGDYIKPDGPSFNQPKGRRRSDQYHLQENGSYRTPSNTKRRSSRKGNKTSYSDSSLKTKSRSVIQDPSVPKFVLNDSDDFPAVGSPSTAATVPTRRITPTTITSHLKVLTTRVKQQPLSTPAFSKSYQEEPSLQSSSFGMAFPSPTASLHSQSQSSQGLEKERELLRLERLKQQASLPDPNKESSSSNPVPACSLLTPQTPTKPSKTSSAFSYPSEFAKASRDEVTYQDHVDKLVDLYSACTKECLMPNLTMELYFLVHLLTAKGSVSTVEGINGSCDLEDVNYLCSIHNCVYFAVSVLLRQFWLLLFLDKATLRLLSEVPHLSNFSPTLKAKLESAVEGGPAKSIMVTTKSPVQAVPFLADTDNRRNFPSEEAFHGFKKQRDKFYELVREWLDCHNKPEWSMVAVMSKRIRDLVQQVVEISNCTHFARLFTSQLTRMCQGEDPISDYNDDGKEQGFLGNLKKTNPEKFKRLEERFCIPTVSGGPSPPPTFPGCQEFFKTFILVADSFLFNQHLIDNFASKITELNEMQFGLSDQEGDAESNYVDDEVRSSFSSSLQSARILAKFLGFLVFLPYRGHDALPEAVQGDVITLRSKCCPPIDILDSLRLSCHQHRLVMTIPWVVEYLSMVDPMAAQLDSIQVILRLLVQVYRKVSARLSSDPTSYNMLLVLLVLGWLFEVPGMPASMYFLSFGDDFVFDSAIMQRRATGPSLDNLHLVDQQLLYLCCPYLGDIRALLTDASLGFGSKTTPMKKITPIAAKTPPQPIPTAQQLQQDLEKNFFDNHSPSLKKTVDFVSSRLASNCIKDIDARLVSAAREKAGALLEEEVRLEEVGTLDEDWTSEMQGALLKRVKLKGEEVTTATKETAVEQAKTFVFGRSRDALFVLLPEESSDQVLQAAAYITGRLALERTTHWINTQIQAAIQQELKTDVEKALRIARKETVEKPKFCLPVHHDRDAHPPSVVLQQYKDVLRYLLTGHAIHQVTLDELTNLLAATRQVLHSRQDLTPVAWQTIQQLSMELVCALAIVKPAHLQSPIQAGSICSSDVYNERPGTTSEEVEVAPVEPCNLGLVENKASLVSTDSGVQQHHSWSSGDFSKSNLRHELLAVKGTTPKKALGVHQGNSHCEKPISNDVGGRNNLSPDVNKTVSKDDLSKNSDGGMKSFDSKPSGRACCLDAFVELWKDHFKCQVPAQLFLCPRTVLLIRQGQDGKESWESVGHAVCTLLTQGLIDPSTIAECLVSLLESDSVEVTEAVAHVMWTIGQHAAQVSSHKQVGDEWSSPNVMSLLHALISRCPEGDILHQLCDYAQHQMHH
ncbi:codanin-1-like [Acanthaster planci]|uniref:Codanin-1-like n=1 Tax=Acanthaster planci TaxID=133434 RepID=A0A8B7ZI33_ACAPL|nr:codanin-1-like [Acanthaster planci]